MIGRASPEDVELALEVVNLFARGARAGGAHCTLESLAFDWHCRLNTALEIEDRWNQAVPEAEASEWCDVADVAQTIARVSRSAAA
jgi:hypothetical protein